LSIRQGAFFRHIAGLCSPVDILYDDVVERVFFARLEDLGNVLRLKVAQDLHLAREADVFRILWQMGVQDLDRLVRPLFSSSALKTVPMPPLPSFS
jgi:hypothetical protein